MSPLTKIFVVLLVVMSLMVSSGLIVFINRTENYKTTLAAQKAEVTRAHAELQNAKTELIAVSAYADAARNARDAAIADGQTALAKSEEEVAGLKADIATSASLAKTQAVSIDTAMAINKASEDQRKALNDLLETTRTDNNTLNTKSGQLNLAISDLTNKLEVALRLGTAQLESIAELKAAKERAEKQLADAGLSLENKNVGLTAGAPPINGVVRSNRLINGIPYATISVGADAQVVKGMHFSVVDTAAGKFLGDLTIEQVDEREATGKLEGPGIADVHTGTEVKTQLSN